MYGNTSMSGDGGKDVFDKPQHILYGNAPAVQ